MSEFNFTLESGQSLKLPTAGKYCDRDIVVTAEGGSSNAIDQVLEGTLESIESNAAKLRPYAFYNYSALAEINVPEATEICERALYGTSLVNASFPNVETIGIYVFQKCASLETVSFEKAKTIGNYSFYECKSLKTVNAPTMLTIGDRVFSSCTGLETINAQNVEEIGPYGFNLCSSLTEINFPKLTTCGTYAFQSCSQVQKAEFPLLQSVERNVFSNCSNLKYAVLPSVTSLGKQSFANCKKLEYIDFSGCTAVPSLVNSDAFTNVPTTCRFIVPAALLDEWKAASIWANFADQIVAAE